MDIVLHAGAHCTDEDRLVKCLLKNKDLFLRHGIAVPGLSRYRRQLRDAMQAVEQGGAAEEAREGLMEAMVQDSGIGRVLLSNDNFFGVPKIAVADGLLYPRAEQRIDDLLRLFPGDRLTLAIGLRNPATFLPALFADSPHEDFLTFLDGTEPALLDWSELITRLRAAHPDLGIILWCNEDTPMIWGSIIRRLAGLEDGTRVSGGFDLLSEIMSKEGMQRFRAYLHSHPVMTEGQKHRVMGAFLDKYALPEAIEEELDLPGWDAAYVEALTQRYEADVALLEARPDLTFIAA